MIFYLRLLTPSKRKCLSPSESLLQVRLKLTTSALLCCTLPYKYRTLTEWRHWSCYQRLWSLGKLITPIWSFMLGFGLHRKLNVSRLLKPCSMWGSSSQPRHCSGAYCLISTMCWLIAPLEVWTDGATGAVDSKAFYKTLYSLGSDLSIYSMNFPQTDYSHLIFYVRLWIPSQMKCLSPSKTLLHVRLELTTSPLLSCILPYKYYVLTACATGAVDWWRHWSCWLRSILPNTLDIGYSYLSI